MKRSRSIFSLLGCILFILACGSLPTSEATSVAAAPVAPITINGTHEVHSDIKGGDAFAFSGKKIDMVVTFTATSQEDQTMKGTAQVTYVQSYEFRYEEEGYEPCLLAWTIEPITWTAELTGRMQQNTDGSITVVLIANPREGPSFLQDLSCEGETSTTPVFDFLGGVLVDGKYRSKFEYLPHPMTSGSHFETTIMEVVP